MNRSTTRDSLILEKKARQVKFLLVNCDGILTDGAFYYLENGDEMKKFATSDLIGARRLRIKSLIVCKNIYRSEIAA